MFDTAENKIFFGLGEGIPLDKKEKEAVEVEEICGRIELKGRLQEMTGSISIGEKRLVIEAPDFAHIKVGPGIGRIAAETLGGCIGGLVEKSIAPRRIAESVLGYGPLQIEPLAFLVKKGVFKALNRFQELRFQLCEAALDIFYLSPQKPISMIVSESEVLAIGD
jgi:hypothetical protein